MEGGGLLPFFPWQSSVTLADSLMSTTSGVVRARIFFRGVLCCLGAAAKSYFVAVWSM